MLNTDYSLCQPGNMDYSLCQPGNMLCTYNIHELLSTFVYLVPNPHIASRILKSIYASAWTGDVLLLPVTVLE